jgi:EpsI family protein
MTGEKGFLPSRRDLLVGGAALAAAGVAVARMPHAPMLLIGKDQLDKIVPLHIGDWSYETASGLVLPPPDQLARLLYDQQLTRTYSSPTQLPVMLLMAYGSSQGGMLQIHRPEICYPASGFQLTETRVTSVPLDPRRSVASRSFVAHSDTRNEQVLYWTRIGDDLPTSWTAQRIAVVRSNLAGRIPDGLLVRVSVVADDIERSQQTLKLFVRQMLAEMPLATQRMLIGPAAG